jgi:Carboxypeptidase regulatory-like domain/TonB-dependent Receptor Plug Domain
MILRAISVRCKALPLLCLGPSLLAGLAFGQATTGSISGRVIDSTGGVIVGAKISIKDLDKGLITTLTTNGAGDFTQTAMPPDHYAIAVEKHGFATANVPGFKLDIDQKAHFNVSMQVGEVSTELVVSESAPVLQVQGGETGQVIGSREIADLPTLGRDFTSLMLLVPGVVSGGGGNNLNLSVNGQREFSNSVQINGVEVTGTNNDTNVRPSPDAIQEFKIVTSSYAPEFGRASGGAVIIQTKSGTNNLHGSSVYLYRPTETAANNNFAPKGSSPALKQKNYGATIGGPIIKDKAFLFLGYEGFRLQNSVSYLGQTLVGQNQVTFDSAGDANLSALLDPYTGNQVPIFDPYNTANNYGSAVQQYPGNIIPASVVSKAGRNIVQQLFPAPQNSSNPYGNFSVTQFYPQNSNVGNLRGDYTFSQNNRLYVTYDAEQGDTAPSDPYAGKIPISGGGGADSAYSDGYENHSMALTFDHVFSSNLLNEARGTYLITSDSEKSLLDGTNLATKFGIANANIPGFPTTFGFPQIQMGSGATTGGSTFRPYSSREKIFGFVDSISYTRGQHNAKLGYEYRHINSASNYSLFPVPYEYFAGPGSNFTSDPTYCYYTYSPCDYSTGFYDPNAYYYNGGAEIADLLLGLPEIVEQGLQLTKPKTSANEHTFYAQDYWQITPKLNLTYGVRYEYVQPFVEENNNMANFNLTTLSLDLAGRGSNSRSLVNSNKTNFMPRVGVSYQLRPRTVLRGGFGIFYSPENDSRDVILTENYPFYTYQKFTNDFYGPYDLSYVLDTGVARSTTITIPSGASSINLTTVPGAVNETVNSEPTNFPTANSKNYNVTVQQQLDNSTSFEIAYVGAATRNLSYKVGNYNVNNHLSSKIGFVQTLLPAGISNYNALQAKINRSFNHGYGLLISYTWSHNLDNGPAPPNLGRGGDSPQNPFNLGSEYANSDSDVRNNLVASQLFELPFGHGKRFFSNANSLAQGFIGGWQLNSITTLHGGRPVNILSDSNNPNYPGLRPNLIGNAQVSHRTKTEWFNQKAFQVPTGQAASTKTGATTPLVSGNAPRNFIYGPGYTDEDLSLFKSFSLPREMRFQIRIEAFNVLNTSRYGQPDGDLAHLGTSTNPGTFGTITGGLAGANQRVLQFAGHFNF